MTDNDIAEAVRNGNRAVIADYLESQGVRQDVCDFVRATDLNNIAKLKACMEYRRLRELGETKPQATAEIVRFGITPNIAKHLADGRYPKFSRIADNLRESGTEADDVDFDWSSVDFSND